MLRKVTETLSCSWCGKTEVADWESPASMQAEVLIPKNWRETVVNLNPDTSDHSIFTVERMASFVCSEECSDRSHEANNAAQIEYVRVWDERCPRRDHMRKQARVSMDLVEAVLRGETGCIAEEDVAALLITIYDKAGIEPPQSLIDELTENNKARA